MICLGFLYTQLEYDICSYFDYVEIKPQSELLYNLLLSPPDRITLDDCFI